LEEKRTWRKKKNSSEGRDDLRRLNFYWGTTREKGREEREGAGGWALVPGFQTENQRPGCRGKNPEGTGGLPRSLSKG